MIAPARNRHEGPPVLDPVEAVHGTCFFDGYYTFATGPTATAEMRADTRGTGEVRSALPGEGGTTLTLVRGNRLMCGSATFRYAGRNEARAGIEATLSRFAKKVGEVGHASEWSDVRSTCVLLAERMMAADPF